MHRAGFCVFAAATLAAVLAAQRAARSQPDPLKRSEGPKVPLTRSEGPRDPLAARGYRVSTGAAAGYLEDHVCATCHETIAASYRPVGMARAFSRPLPNRDIEDFQNGPFVHAASQQHFEMTRQGDRLLFKRYQLDAEGQPIN